MNLASSTVDPCTLWHAVAPVASRPGGDSDASHHRATSSPKPSASSVSPHSASLWLSTNRSDLLRDASVTTTSARSRLVASALLPAPAPDPVPAPAPATGAGGAGPPPGGQVALVDAAPASVAGRTWADVATTLARQLPAPPLPIVTPWRHHTLSSNSRRRVTPTCAVPGTYRFPTQHRGCTYTPTQVLVRVGPSDCSCLALHNT